LVQTYATSATAHTTSRTSAPPDVRATVAFETVVSAVTDALDAEGGDAPFRAQMRALVCSGRLA
jgi:hypothetical protein